MSLYTYINQLKQEHTLNKQVRAMFKRIEKQPLFNLNSQNFINFCLDKNIADLETLAHVMSTTQQNLTDVLNNSGSITLGQVFAVNNKLKVSENYGLLWTNEACSYQKPN